MSYESASAASQDCLQDICLNRIDFAPGRSLFTFPRHMQENNAQNAQIMGETTILSISGESDRSIGARSSSPPPAARKVMKGDRSLPTLRCPTASKQTKAFSLKGICTSKTRRNKRQAKKDRRRLAPELQTQLQAMEKRRKG